MGIRTVTVEVHRCTRCGSDAIMKNGHNQWGNAQFLCRACGRSSVLKPKVAYSEEKKAEIVRAYQERGSLQGMQRLYGVAPATLSGWLKKSSPHR